MSNYSIINLSAYASPDVVEQKHKGWVEYRIKGNKEYDYPNGFYQYLIDRAKGSVTNGSVIGGFSRWIYGEGLSAKDASRKPDEFARMISLLSKKDLKRAVNDRKKLMMAALQVTKNSGKITSITHFPVKTLLPEIMNDKGEIEAWYYHPNWKEFKSSDKPERIPAYGFGGKSGNEIYIIKNYNGASDYFGEDDGYVGCLPYTILEEEIGDYQVNDAINGFTPTTIVNFNNGIPDEEQRKAVVRDVESKTTGARGKKVIVAFNDDETKKTTVEKIAIDNAPEHYEYLSQECERKILAGHRAPSELLGFNKENGGFSNNAEELKNKFIAFQNFEVQPYQIEFTDALEEILADEGIALNLYFVPLSPFEGIKPQTTLSEERQELSDEEYDLLLEDLSGELVDAEWELVDSREQCDSNEAIEDWAKAKIMPKKNALQKLFKSNPSAKSYLDRDIYKVRYTYESKKESENSRSFCVAMTERTKKGVVYRKEDIDQASFRGVNKSHGHKGMPYSLFRFKGGVRCSHFWLENLYRLKKKTDGTYYEDKALSSSEQVDSIPKKFIPKGKSFDDSKVAPMDMPPSNKAFPETAQGHHPNYRA